MTLISKKKKKINLIFNFYSVSFKYKCSDIFIKKVNFNL